jgi:signal transduction histidine kinase
LIAAHRDANHISAAKLTAKPYGDRNFARDYPDSTPQADFIWQHSFMTHPAEENLGDLTLAIDRRDALFAAHPVPSLLFDRKYLVVAANSAAQVLFRCGAAELEGFDMVTFFPELGSSPRATRQVTSMRSVAVRRPDGTNFIARLQWVAPGVDALMLATVEDMTEHEQALAAANREIESFTSAAGHDLRGPLRILKGFTEALDDECGAVINEEGKSFLKEILKATDRMEGLIDGLLALSRASRLEMACEKLDLTTLGELVTYELRHGKSSREVDCKVEPAISGWGDVRLMMTVLRILFGNAWKYTSRKEQGTIRFHAEERDGRTWYCVTDNGAGFDMAHASRLFQPFIRLHRQDEFPGHGLGLATVQRIVKRHGGEIEAQSAVNEGTTIRFWLPPPPHGR